jgi:hypothetical protein
VKFAGLHFALRETQALARRPQLWVLLGAVGLLMGMVGPFGTFEMPLLPRLAYWLTVVISTTAICIVVERIVVRLVPDTMPGIAASAIGGALGGIPIAIGVRIFNLLVFGNGDDEMTLLALLAYSVPIAALVTTSSHLIVHAGAPVLSPPPEQPALLDRLPPPQRGKLLHIAVSDHYVDVLTDKGKALVLMRFSDAIRQAAPVPGIQVHRSHWVALDAVRRLSRRGGKPVLELETGALVPVSRSYLADVRKAGF